MREALDDCIEKNEHFDEITQKKKDQAELDV